MPLIKARVKELIPTAKYANVEIELAAEVETVHEKTLVKDINDLYDSLDRVLQIKRDEIIEDLEKGN